MAKYDWTICPWCGRGQLMCSKGKYTCDECHKVVTGQAVYDELAKIERESSKGSVYELRSIECTDK